MQRWLLKQMCLKAGAHARKRPKWFEQPGERPPVTIVGPWHGHHHAYQAPPAPEDFEDRLTAEVGNIDNALFRFMLGSAERGETKTQCRCCLKTMWTAFEREHHSEQHECWRYLTDAYNILTEQGACVVCELQVKHTKWGVPLCQPRKDGALSCETLWKFLMLQPDLLHEALECVLEERPNAEIHSAICFGDALCEG